MAQISRLWGPPCSRAGPSARSRAVPKQVPREGRSEGQEGPSSAGKFSSSWLWVRTVHSGVSMGSWEVLHTGWVLIFRWAASPSVKYPARRKQPPSLRAGGRDKGQCEVVRGKRQRQQQQLDELQFLSGRGAGGGMVLAGPGKGSRPSVMAGTERKSAATDSSFLLARPARPQPVP